MFLSRTCPCGTTTTRIWTGLLSVSRTNWNEYTERICIVWLLRGLSAVVFFLWVHVVSLHLIRLYEVSGNSRSLHITTLETEARQSQEQSQLAPEPRQKIATSHVGEKPCQNKGESSACKYVSAQFQCTCTSKNDRTICHLSSCQIPSQQHINEPCKVCKVSLFAKTVWVCTNLANWHLPPSAPIITDRTSA